MSRDPRLGRLLKRMLEDERHVVDVAADGRGGLEVVTGTLGLDVVILDVGLPDISGWTSPGGVPPSTDGTSPSSCSRRAIPWSATA